jgi:hypothetical protein
MSEIEDLKKEIEDIKASLLPKYPKISSIQASGELKAALDTFREEGKKESFEDLIWKLIEIVEETKSD